MDINNDVALYNNNNGKNNKINVYQFIPYTV